MLAGRRGLVQRQARIPPSDILRGEERGMVQADHFGCVVSFDEARAGVPARDGSFRTQQKNRIVSDAVHQQAESFFSLTERLKLHAFTHAIEFDEHRDLAVQHLRHDRFEQIIHGAARQPSNDVLL
jgi:hypothetical protein